MPWGLSMFLLSIYVLNSRRKGDGVGFGGEILLGVEVRFAVLFVFVSGFWEGGSWSNWRRRFSLCLLGTGSETCCSGTGRPTTGKNGLLEAFTHGALLNLLRISAPWEHHIVSKVLISLAFTFCLTDLWLYECVWVCFYFIYIFYCHLCSSFVMDAATGFFLFTVATVADTVNTSKRINSTLSREQVTKCRLKTNLVKIAYLILRNRRIFTMAHTWDVKKIIWWYPPEMNGGVIEIRNANTINYLW